VAKYFSSDTFIIILIIIFNLGLRLFRLDSPNEAFFDEKVFYLEAARSYLTGFTDPNFEHPPLGKIILADGIQLFGDNTWGWRIMPVLFGTLGVIITYLLAKKIFASTKIALLSAFFLTFDFLWFIFSRTALLEIFLATFSLLAIYFLWNYYQKTKVRDLILFSLFVGLALAVKWSGVLLLLPLGILMVFKRKSLIKIGLSLLLVGAIGIGVYSGSYLPYIQQNHSWSEVWGRQLRIWNYHTRDIKDTAIGAIRPYFWVANPMHIFYHPEEKSQFYVIALSNPFFFWGALLALGFYVRQLMKKWEEGTGFLVVAVLSLYLPWFFVSRYVFFYYLLSGLPLLAIILSKGLVDLDRGTGSWARRLRSLRSGFITGNALGFFLFYPLLSALPVTSWYLSVLLGGR
jgi:dolichyl-phosphate-mannose-protein mannosyltransferase